MISNGRNSSSSFSKVIFLFFILFIDQYIEAIQCYSCANCAQYNFLTLNVQTDEPLVTCASNFVCSKTTILSPDYIIHRSCVSTCTEVANNGLYEVNCCSNSDGCNGATQFAYSTMNPIVTIVSLITTISNINKILPF